MRSHVDSARAGGVFKSIHLHTNHDASESGIEFTCFTEGISLTRGSCHHIGMCGYIHGITEHHSKGDRAVMKLIRWRSSALWTDGI